MRLFYLLPALLIIVLNCSSSHADYDFDFDTDIEGGEFLRLETDVDNDLDLTRIRISESGGEIVFLIEEYAGNVLVDSDVRDFDLDSFDYVVVVSGQNCRLDLESSAALTAIIAAGGDQNDRIRGIHYALGYGGNDDLFDSKTGRGGLGNDLIAGCLNAWGEEGDDVIHAANFSEAPFVRAGPGNDWVIGSSRADSLYGGPGDDVIIGGPGRDTIWGGGGFDTLYGGDGDDIMNGGDGVETPAEAGEILNGQAGADTFYQWTVNGNPIETWDDFRAHEGDRYQQKTWNSFAPWQFYYPGAGGFSSGGIK
ncbi:MAG: calcium-binding protein [Pirellulaceae bacterium]